MPKRKAPKGTFWRGDVLGVAPRYVARTSNGRYAQTIQRLRKLGARPKGRAVAAVYYGEGRRVFADVLEAWEPYIAPKSPQLRPRDTPCPWDSFSPF